MATTQKKSDERSHLENKERAYIAASHRTDRSIEARMVSARKASEVHKRRTGKALYVTEKAVENEEMYREVTEDPYKNESVLMRNRRW